MRADAERPRETLSAVSGTSKQDDGLIELPLDPADVDVPGIGAMRLGVGEEARHVLPLNVRLVALPGSHRRGIFFPGLAAVERAANEDAVTSRAMGPIGRAPQFVEVQRAEVDVALVIEG